MSLVDVCGEHDLVREVQPILDSVWDGVSRGRRPDGRSPIRRLERLGGSEAPDDDQPIYLAHEALEALYAAAIVAFELRRYDSDPVDLGGEIHSALDGVIHFAIDRRPIIIDPRHPPPAGPYEAKEQAACLRDRETASAMTIVEAARQIRARAQDERRALQGQMRESLRDVRAFGRNW